MRGGRLLPWLLGAALLISAGGVSLAAAEPAAAQLAVAQSQVVSGVPASSTPNIDGGTVFALAQVGSTIVAGGSFTSATPAGSSTALARTGIVAFDQASGSVSTAFAPQLNGTVQALLPGPVANTVYVGGTFSTVGGVASKSLALLDLTTGALITTFRTPVLNGVVYGLRVANGQLFVTGSFTTAGGAVRDGLMTLNPTSGALTAYSTVALTGHHNYNGSGAFGAVGGRALDISPDGRRAIVVGDFKMANGVIHDQIVMLDLTSTSAVIDPNWNTSALTARCAYNAFDSYVEDVSFAPDGSYFAIADTGASTFSTNTDGTRSLCDSASKWSSTDTGTNVKPTWIDYTGNDTFWSIAVTGSAIYAGGHERWLNNPNASDAAGAGAIARPGVVALDPVSGLPLTWNPGRNPRGVGAYALLATAQGLYVGSDTNYFGDYKWQRHELGFFPLAGGYTPASTATRSLPANVYASGLITSGSGADDLTYRGISGSTIGGQGVVPNTGVAWGATRGAFMVGTRIFYGDASGNFWSASFDGWTVGTPVSVDPYDDPTWDNVNTGSGGTYQGVKSGYYSDLPNVTGAFYSNGRLYYSIQGQSPLYYRYFTPDSGTIGGTRFTATGGNFANIAGMFASGSTIYYANRSDGTLHTVSFTDGGTNGQNPSVTSSTDKTISGPAIDNRDWRTRGMFAYGDPTAPDQPPTAVASASCVNSNCTFDGSRSSDPDGTVASYAWAFGDGATGTGAAPTHSYAMPGTYTYTLTVTDNHGLTSSPVQHTVTATASTTPIGFTAAVDGYASSSTSLTVQTPGAVTTGDTELLYVTTANATANAIGTPSGWTPVATQNSLPLQAAVFKRTAEAGSAGSTVTASVSSAGPIGMQLIDYRNVSPSLPVTAGASDYSTASHTAPAVTVSTGGSWVVSFWSDKSSSTTAWALPSGVTGRDQLIGSGTSHLTGEIADSGAPVPTGTYPAQTATVGATASPKGAMISLVLTPVG